MPVRRSLAERILARILTGPAAFALAGTIDVLAVLLVVLRQAAKTGLRRPSRGPGPPAERRAA